MGSAALLLWVLPAMWIAPLMTHAAGRVAPADSPLLPGLYECQGMGADGRAYRGAVIIEPDGNRFLVHWYISAKLTAVGVGIREGDMLAVSFLSADAGGVVLYRIDGERLVGRWSGPLTGGAVFDESLTRVGDVPERSTQPPSPPTPAKPGPSGDRPFGTTRPVRWQVGS